MTLKNQLSSDLPVFFNIDDFGETVSYNSVDIEAVVDHGFEEDANSLFDFVDIEVKASDVATVTYRTDTLVYGGLTWRYPKIVSQDVHTKKIRFIRNQKPKIR